MLKKLITATAVLNTVVVNANEVDLKNTTLYNQTPYITSQCYTKTVGIDNKKHNPCYSCHTKNIEPNFTLQDDDLQESYDFPASALSNPWTNLFKDRTKQVEAISDKEILKYVKKDNYKKLSSKLNNIPKNWDYNNNGKWDGYIPDCQYNFDNEGFDKTPNDKYTGWRAFGYYPFLGTFWPTNGSTDDVLIRLSKDFQQNIKGEFDIEIYKLNLSIIESLIKQKSIDINPIDEVKYGVDLNQNGKLDIANKIVFNWKTPSYDIKNSRLFNFSMSYVGLAKKRLNSGKLHIAPGLYPINTEFLHSVRYIDVDKTNNIKMAKRMKELRYGIKTSWLSYSDLEAMGISTLKEKNDFPDRTEQYIGDIEIGINNKKGWYYQGFIEDKYGELRPQSYEETLYCIGCHSNIGAIVDSTFVFSRKFEKDTDQNGWYHWTQKGLKGIKDKKLSSGKTEYINYLKVNNSGDEFRENKEILEKFFDKDLNLKQNEISKIKDDISHLLLPSTKRAIKLNKAYKVIVDEQSFIYGRDATIKPAVNVYEKIDDGQSTDLNKINVTKPK
ncbi:MAG: hypothetical protein U9N59_09470 [Campylobacterota bacterium]|nr:hypothetical protein [Campylobacterota bacterium]